MDKLTPEKFNELKNSSYLIDTRRPEIFASCHIKNSINIPGGGNFCGWAGMVVPSDQPLILLVEEEEHILETVEHLRLVGLKNILGFVIWNRSLNSDMDNLELLPVKDAHELDDLFIIDVRTLSEWNLGHIKSAHHKELSKFKEWMKDLPEDKKIATICGSGFRSSIAASILQKRGLEDVASIQGGMQAWRQANFPIASGMV